MRKYQIVLAAVMIALLSNTFAVAEETESVTESFVELIEDNDCLDEETFVDDEELYKDIMVDVGDCDGLIKDQEEEELLIVTINDDHRLKEPGMPSGSINNQGLRYTSGSHGVYDTCFGNQLDEDSHYFYAEETTYYITQRNTGFLSFTFDIVTTPYSYAAEEVYDLTSAAYKSMESAIKKDMQAALDAFIYDHPSFFWSRTSSWGDLTVAYKEEASSPTGYTGYVVGVTFKPNEVFEGASAYIESFDQNAALVAANISNTSDYDGDGIVSEVEYIKGSHDYICNRMSYASEIVGNPSLAYKAFTAGGAFLNSFGTTCVCEGYSKAMKLLCDLHGIPCVLIGGYVGGNGHMWNGIQVGEVWYLTDLTWDDGDTVDYSYFLTYRANGNRISSGDFSETGGFRFSYPSLSATAYPYCAGEHKWEETETQGEVTCLSGSITHFTCQVCFQTKDVVNDPLPHEIDENGRCKKCRSFEDPSLNNLDHAIISVSSQTYTGSALMPNVTVTINSIPLIKDTDYLVSYTDNVNKGTATITVTGIGVITGSRTATFEIKAASLSQVAFEKIPDQIYSGSGVTPAIAAKYKGMNLSSDDMTLLYRNNTQTGKATVTITGKGNFSGIRNLNFQIKPAILTKDCLKSISNVTYTGGIEKPEVVLEYNGLEISPNDYDIICTESKIGIVLATIIGKNNFDGNFSAPYQILSRSITEAACQIESGGTFDGTAKCPEVTVTLGGKTLVSGTDYNAYYKDNTHAGTATVTITGIRNYKDSISHTFNIEPSSIKSASFDPIAATTCNGSAQKPDVKVMIGSSALTDGTDYTLSYANNVYPGTATVTITGKGDYTGSISKTFTINYPTVKLATPSISKLTAGSKRFTVKWKKKTDISGYYIMYSTNKNFKNAKTFTVSASATKKTFKKLKKNMRYYVKFYSYKTLYGQTFKSSWSKVKKVKTK